MPSAIEEDLIRFTVNLPAYDSIFYKSIARNDHQWVTGETHQAGVVIPRETLGFFGIHDTPDQNETYELEINWFLRGEVYTRADWEGNRSIEKSRLKYYCEGNRASRPESHLTCVYNPYFENLNDGALLVIGRRKGEIDYEYDALIVDTDQQDLIEDLITITDIPEGPSWGIISDDESVEDIGMDLFEKIKKLAEELYGEKNKLPTTKETSDIIWNLIRDEDSYLPGQIKCPGLSQSKTPFETAIKNAPGNLIRWLLQKLEFKFLRVIEKLHYPSIIIREIQNKYGETAPETWEELEDAVGISLDQVIEVSKSLTQSRRSRAGNSFEWYINNLLTEYEVNFERQAGTRRVDFRLHVPGDFIQLSAKTTTRERWKQVHKNSYFITMDRTVTESKLKKIAARNLKLVVPEEDKKDLEHYGQSDSVLSFKQFFSNMQ